MKSRAPVSKPQQTDTLAPFMMLRRSLQSELEPDPLQRKPNSTQDLPKSGLNANFCQVPANGTGRPLLQTKLVVGPTNDKYEQEADRVADQVMRMPGPATAPLQNSAPHILHNRPEPNPFLQRQTTESEMMPEEDEKEEIVQAKEIASAPLVKEHDAHGKLQRQETEEEEEGSLVQAKANQARQPTVPSQLEAQLGQSTGQTLPKSTQTFMESRFSHDFSQVRVHTGARAETSAQAIKAKAFTVGHNIVFGARQYAPDTAIGRHLLAHELAHVIQQKKAQPMGLRYLASPTFSERLNIIQRQDSGEPVSQEPQQVENPQYDEAVDHVREFYERQQTIVQILARMRDRGLELFSIYSSEKMNPADPNLMVLMEVAIAFIPLASALGKTFRILRSQQGFLQHPLVTVAAPGATLTSRVRGASLGVNEERVAREESRANRIESLADLEVETLVTWWEEETRVREALRSLRYAPSNIDLHAEVRKSLGEIPTGDDLREAARLARDQFELQLYREFYFGRSGRSSIHTFIDPFTERGSPKPPDRPPGLRLEGVPRRVRQRITELNGWKAVTEAWSPKGRTTIKGWGRSISTQTEEGDVKGMTRELLLPDLASRVLQTYRDRHSSSAERHKRLREMIAASGAVVDPAARILRANYGGFTEIWHEPLIFQQGLIAAGATENELFAIVKILSAEPKSLILYRVGGVPRVNVRR